MINLIRLEIKKFKFKGYIRSAFITDLIILAFMFFVMIISKVENTSDFNNYNNLIAFITTIINSTYTVFAGVLISKLIIGEYKNKTVNVLFSYPVDRKKIILAKVVLITVFIFISIVFAFLFVFSIVYISDVFTPIISDSLEISMLCDIFLNIVILAAFSSILSLIPLYFGFRKKSVSTTILTSLLVMAILNSSSNGQSLSANNYINLVFAVISIILTYITIKKIDCRDAAA
ncbi:ABC transporter permease [Abyssisolibacter fermentans]|uniref:ABC transporter permease n=1 Tax=Abyssisolibacter fermentans TaxID=1766203 RepID=UPI000833330E|nr:ABC transporter permease [Abyssisolibacter fermentans]